MTSRKILSVLILAALAAGCARTFSAGAAVVNGVSISKATLDEAVKRATRGQAQSGGADVQRQQLMQLIAGELIKAEADKRKLGVSDAKVEEQLSQIKAQFPDDATYRTRLKENFFTEESLRDSIRGSLMREALVKALVTPVTAAQVKRYYQSQLASYRQVSTKHILIAVDQTRSDAQAKTLAQQILARLKAGEDFAALAKKYSADPGSKDKGGKLGYFAVSGLDPAYGEAAQKAKIGALVGPVRSQFGWHIIVTLGKRTQPLSEIEEQLHQQLETQANDAALQGFLSQRLRAAQIEVNPLYGDWDPASGQIVEHTGFVPASPPALDQNQPDLGGLIPQGQ